MTISKTTFVFFLAGLLFFGSAAWAEHLYVRSFKIEPMETLVSGKKMAPIMRGKKVEQLYVEQQWVKIGYDGKTGWVHNLSLSKTPPQGRVSLLASNVDISTVARKRASGFTSTGAARGLRDSSRVNLADRVAPKFDVLDEIEKTTIDPEEAVAFLLEDE